MHKKLIKFAEQERQHSVDAVINEIELQRGVSMSLASKTAIKRTYLEYAKETPVELEKIVPRPFSGNFLKPDLAAEWIRQHPKMLQPTARFFIEHLRYIDQDYFEQKLEAVALEFLLKIGEEKYYSYLPELKTTSMSWVAELLFEKELLQKNNIPKEHKLHDKKRPLNLVIADDCAYSGQHLYDTMWELSRTLRDIFPQTEINFHCLVPFISTRALDFFISCSVLSNDQALRKEKISTMGLKAKNMFLHLYYQEIVPTLNEQFKDVEMKFFERLLGFSSLNFQFFGGKIPLFFQHKIADSLSVPNTLFKGRLIHSFKKQPFLEIYRPPYKN